MSNVVVVQNQSMSQIESVLIGGDLAKLTPEQRHSYYIKVCETLGLNPLTKPFDYITLNGKLVLYANKGCAEQLRSIRKISVTVTAREMLNDLCVVTSNARGADGREDSSTGAVSVAGLRGEALANAMMKAETKSKRRVTLSICGLNMLDESEVETIPEARGQKVFPDQPVHGVDGDTVGGPYRVDFGQWRGRGIEELLADPKIGPKAVADYIEYLERPDQVSKRKPDMVAKVAEFIERASDALAALENQLSKERFE